MEYLRQTIDSIELSGIFNLPQALRNKKVDVIILPMDEDDVPNEKPNYALQLGFAKGAEIPDCFFEPLSEEELQLWGL